MRRFILVAPILLVFSITFLYASKFDDGKKHHHLKSIYHDDVDIEIDNGYLIISADHDRDLYVEISPDYELIISGNRVQLNKEQQQLVVDYYDHFMEIVDRAKVIGKKGAKIGLEGAKIGMMAAGAAFKTLFFDEDDDEIEEALDEKSDELEERSEELGAMADELEIIAEEFEDIHYRMRDEIPDLAKLSWF